MSNKEITRGEPLGETLPREEQLEGLLTTAFLSLREAQELTEDKIDIPFLLDIVGSYITARDAGTLLDNVRVPAEIFADVVFPIVDNSTLEVEEISEDGDS